MVLFLIGGNVESPFLLPPHVSLLLILTMVFAAFAHDPKYLSTLRKIKQSQVWVALDTT